MKPALIIAALLAVFYVLPSAVLTLLLFRRKNTHDFDSAPDRIDRSIYAPYKERILAAFREIRANEPEEVSAEAYDGVTLKAEWLDRGFSRTVILFHGFCSTPFNNFAIQICEFLRRGYNVLAVWQRGHGKSGGRYTTLGIIEQNDVLTWIERVGALAPGSDIVLYGLSMGGATVAYASDRLPGKTVRAIVLDCSYPSPYHQMYAGKGAMALIWAPLMPLIRLFSKLFVHIDIKQPTSAALEKAAAPAFFIGGLADRKVPFSQFVMNYEACSSEKELLAVPNAPHAMAFAEADGQQIERLFKFIDKFITDHQGGKHEH